MATSVCHGYASPGWLRARFEHPHGSLRKVPFPVSAVYCDLARCEVVSGHVDLARGWLQGSVQARVGPSEDGTAGRGLSRSVNGDANDLGGLPLKGGQDTAPKKNPARHEARAGQLEHQSLSECSQATEARRKRRTKPSKLTPPSIAAQVEGSGTPAAGASWPPRRVGAG